MGDVLIEFIAHTGEAGIAWVQQYQRYCHLVGLLNSAVPLLRSQKSQEAGKILERVARVLEAEEIPDSIRAVIDQNYYKVQGLYSYRYGDFAGASQSMQMAHHAVARAIANCAFLVPCALQCPELCLNQARVARNQHHWEEMHGYINHLRDMLADRAPLCKSSGGPAVFYSTLRELFFSIRTPSNPTFEELCPLMDAETRMPFYDRIIRLFFRFESSAIDYSALDCQDAFAAL